MQHGICSTKQMGFERPSSSISQGPPNNESKESGTCSNLRGEDSRPVVSHLRKDMCPCCIQKTPGFHSFLLRQIQYEHEPWTFCFGAKKQWPKVKINFQKGHVKPLHIHHPTPKWINSWAELPPRGQHALCSSGGASQGTPGQMHDLHQISTEKLHCDFRCNSRFLPQPRCSCLDAYN